MSNKNNNTILLAGAALVAYLAFRNSSNEPNIGNQYDNYEDELSGLFGGSVADKRLQLVKQIVQNNPSLNTVDMTRALLTSPAELKLYHDIMFKYGGEISNVPPNLMNRVRALFKKYQMPMGQHPGYR